MNYSVLINYFGKNGPSDCLQISVCSASVNQNSQASIATLSLSSRVWTSIYCKDSRNDIIAHTILVQCASRKCYAKTVHYTVMYMYINRKHVHIHTSCTYSKIHACTLYMYMCINQPRWCFACEVEDRQPWNLTASLTLYKRSFSLRCLSHWPLETSSEQVK